MKTQNLIRLAALGIILTLSLFIINQAKAEPATDIFISEYIEGSGVNKALEFYNGTGSSIDLDAGNYLIEFYNNGATSATHSTNLTGSIANGVVFVLASDGANSDILDQADQTLNQDSWFNGNDAVVLKHNGTIIDSMGQIGDSSDWGKNQTLRRKTAVCSGDTNPNDSFNPATEWDSFAQDTSDGLGSHTATCAPIGTNPYVQSTSPANNAVNVALDATVTITFSEPVSFNGNTVAYSCDGSSGNFNVTPTNGATTWTLTPLADFAHSETCTITIDKDHVSDLDAPVEYMVEDYIWSFTTIGDGSDCGPAPTFIHTIQGSGTASSEVGNIHTIEGIVVGDFQSDNELKGFFVQEEDADADADPATSEGIFVYAPSSVDVNEGDLVNVTGTVDEFNELTQLTSISDISLCTVGNTMPTAVSLSFPYPPDNGDVPYPETIENMAVTVPAGLIVTEVYNLGRGGSFMLSHNGKLYQPTEIAAPGAPADAVLEANIRRQILIDDGSLGQNPDPIIHPAPALSLSNRVRTGNTLAANISGVLTYRYDGWSNSDDAYRVHPTNGGATFTDTNPRTATPPSVGSADITVASFNVLNYFNGDGQGGGFPTSRGAYDAEEFDRQRDKIIAAIVALDADIIGLMEIENDGYGSNSAIQDLVNGLNDATSLGTYAFVDPGVTKIGTDEIAVGLLYKPATVSLSGGAAILDDSVDSDYNQGKNRPALAQTFSHIGSDELLTAAVNHLKSKGSDCASIGDPDMQDGQGNCNLTRTTAAEIEAAWLATDPTSSNDSDFLIIGDLNAYSMEDPITALKDVGYVNLTALFNSTQSYVFKGQFGHLDHALASPSMTTQVSGTAVWHINSDEPRAFDYDTQFNPPSFYSPDVYRASDHDPVLIGIDFDQTAISSPTITNISPDNGIGSTETAVTITGTDFRAGITAALVEGSNTYTLTNVVLNGNTTEITAVVPNTVPTGIYDVVVTNLDTQTATLSDGFELTNWRVYIPMIFKN